MVVALALPAPGAPNAEALEGLELIPLRAGFNKVDLDGAGTAATVVVARRENFNAHSFDVVSFYTELMTAADDAARLHVITIYDEEQSRHALELTTSEGADCILADHRLFRDRAHRMAVLITAERKFGETFVDEQPVTFRRYVLKRNTESLVGAPPVYFEFERKWVSKKSYCDVEEAFEKELGVVGRAGPKP